MPEAALAAAQPAGQRGVVARAMDASPTAPLMAVGALGQVLLYNTDTYELMGALPFPEGQVFTLTFSVNGERLLAGGGEEGDSGRAALFDVRTGERVGTYGDYYDTVLAADISPDHRMIALGGPNRKVRVYSVETGEELYMIDEHTEWVLSVKFTPDAEVLATGRYVEELKGHTGAIHALQYTYDSALLASAGNDGTVQIWDTWKYSRVRSFPAHGVPVLQLDINKAGQILTTGQDAAAKMFDIEGKELKAFSGLRDWGYSASFAHDGVKVMAGSWTGEIVMWSADTAEALATLGTMPVKTEG
jgi:WD40 repeat protein